MLIIENPLTGKHLAYLSSSQKEQLKTDMYKLLVYGDVWIDKNNYKESISVKSIMELIKWE